MIADVLGIWASSMVKLQGRGPFGYTPGDLGGVIKGLRVKLFQYALQRNSAGVQQSLVARTVQRGDLGTCKWQLQSGLKRLGFPERGRTNLGLRAAAGEVAPDR